MVASIPSSRLSAAIFTSRGQSKMYFRGDSWEILGNQTTPFVEFCSLVCAKHLRGSAFIGNGVKCDRDELSMHFGVWSNFMHDAQNWQK